MTDRTDAFISLKFGSLSIYLDVNEIVDDFRRVFFFGKCLHSIDNERGSFKISVVKTKVS